MNINELLPSLKQLIDIDSVKTPATPTAPFGEGVKKALEYFLSLAESFGFETHNYDNYVGEIIVGSGEPYAILCHLDVVPVGDNWLTPPFDMTIVGDKIIGRGVIDDKAPAIAILFALKNLVDRKVKFNREIRFILGCDEESGWNCIKHYQKIRKLPDYGFSPDGDFPVIFAEKGILHIKFKVPTTLEILSITGGKRPNVVCDRVALSIKNFDRFDLLKDFEYTINGDITTIVSKGKSCHASTPHNGINALNPIITLLSKLSTDFIPLENLLIKDKFDLLSSRDISGNLTLSTDMVDNVDNFINFTVDIRYPASLTVNDILSIIDKSKIEYDVLNVQEGIIRDKESNFIQDLLKSYEEATKTKAEPIAIGGGTYARALPYGVAFGPVFPGEESVAHESNEYITVDNLGKLWTIYEKSIEKIVR